MLSSAVQLVEIVPAKPNAYGIGLKLFGFIPEPVFTFIPESCSGSTRNTVRNHPGIAFILPRIPHLTFADCVPSRLSPRRVATNPNSRSPTNVDT